MAESYSTWPFVQIATNYQMAFDYDANGNQTYIGWAVPGALTTDSVWRITQQQFNTSNKITAQNWPNNSTAFIFEWNLRATYTYGVNFGYSCFVLDSPNTTQWICTVLTTGNLNTTPNNAVPGGAYNTGFLVLEDSNGVFWTVTISNTGDLITASGGNASEGLTNLPLLDSNNRVWILTVSTVGDLVTT